MSVLFPLYALGALAVGLPLVFHLIQRRPRGEMPFSSLMFLSPSPPRMTRRSRLDNLPLLLLRGLALILLAVAFARPFFRSLADLQLDMPSRRIVLLLDRSASMQRAGVWREAQEEARRVLDEIRPTDRVALATFDDSLQPLVSFDDSLQLEPARRAAGLRSTVANATPGWADTNLGRALVAAADMLQTAVEGPREQGSLPPQIILITDLQAGSDLEELDRFEWPEEIRVDIRPVKAEGTTNASLVVLQDRSATESPASDSTTGFTTGSATDSTTGSATAAESTEAPGGQLAIRVASAADSTGRRFRLGWADAEGKLQGDREYPTDVPPGESRVVRIDPLATADRLMLIGDDHSFDNTLYVARRIARQRTLLYLGDTTDHRSNLTYYLRRAALNTPWQTVHFESLPADTPAVRGSPLADLDPRRTPLVVVGAALPRETARYLRDAFIRSGGHVLVVVTQEATGDANFLPSLQTLLDLPSLVVEEAETADYAMLENIDFRHPLFQPFADPKFSDFTKIRFWTHRRLAADEELTWDVLASFDDGTPALMEQRVGQGTCRVLTSGWQPLESQLALSTKFVPLLAGMLDPLGGQPTLAASYRVGQPVTIPVSASADGDGTSRIRKPDGEIRVPSDAATFRDTDVPGIYVWEHSGESQPFAVNVAPRESRTEPLDPGQLEQRGVRTGKLRTMEEIQDQRRQLRDLELESRQKWWRWLIAGALGVLVVETWLGGWLSRRRRAVNVPAS